MGEHREAAPVIRMISEVEELCKQTFPNLSWIVTTNNPTRYSLVGVSGEPLPGGCSAYIRVILIVAAGYANATIYISHHCLASSDSIERDPEQALKQIRDKWDTAIGVPLSGIKQTENIEHGRNDRKNRDR